MTDDELAAIEARANAATPGPWVARHRSGGCTAADDEMCGLGLDIEGPPEAWSRGQFGRGADATFIAAARADVPALVAEIRRLRAGEQSEKRESPMGGERGGESGEPLGTHAMRDH